MDSELLITAGTSPVEAKLTKASGTSVDVKVGDCFIFSDETDSPLRKITAFTRSGIEYKYVLRSLKPENEGLIRIPHVGLSTAPGSTTPKWSPTGLKRSNTGKESGNVETFELADCPPRVPALSANGSRSKMKKSRRANRRRNGRSRRVRRDNA
jgi:hypothetical protein